LANILCKAFSPSILAEYKLGNQLYIYTHNLVICSAAKSSQKSAKISSLIKTSEVSSYNQQKRPCSNFPPKSTSRKESKKLQKKESPKLKITPPKNKNSSKSKQPTVSEKEEVESTENSNDEEDLNFEDSSELPLKARPDFDYE
jgi:hypothetical protein